jgi:hypothetical protein
LFYTNLSNQNINTVIKIAYAYVTIFYSRLPVFIYCVLTFLHRHFGLHFANFDTRFPSVFFNKR